EHLHLSFGSERTVSGLNGSHLLLDRAARFNGRHFHNHDDGIAGATDRCADDQRVDAFYALLTTYPNLDWISPTLEIADRAARFRALYHLRTPDALQAATAVQVGATAFITNDLAFERVATVNTVIVDRFL